MRIEYVKACMTVTGLRQPGDVEDVSESLARTLIEAGVAALAKPKESAAKRAPKVRARAKAAGDE